MVKEYNFCKKLCKRYNLKSYKNKEGLVSFSFSKNMYDGFDKENHENEIDKFTRRIISTYVGCF